MIRNISLGQPHFDVDNFLFINVVMVMMLADEEDVPASYLNIPQYTPPYPTYYLLHGIKDVKGVPTLVCCNTMYTNLLWYLVPGTGSMLYFVYRFVVLDIIHEMLL